MPGDQPPGLLLDANVLIDYCESDASILALASHARRICVVEQVLAEVDQLDEAEAANLGIRVLEPSLEQLVSAAQAGQTLSFEDHLCLRLAEANALVLVSNDRRLRAACDELGVDVQWGLQIMLNLVARSELDKHGAMEIAISIQRANPYFITEAVIARFRKRLDSA